MNFFGISLMMVVFMSCGNEASTPPSTDTNDASSTEVAAAESLGKTLFQTNCQSCHLPEQKLVGPPLKGALAQWKNRQDLYDYIHNPDTYIKERNDERLKRLKEEYSIVMPGFSYLKEAEIDSIFVYIESAR